MHYSDIPSPSYVIEKQKLINNLEKIVRVAKGANVDIICALKANANWPLFNIIKQYIPNATASSVNEARLVVDSFGAKAHACVPVIKESELDDYLKYCSHLTVNSLSQLALFDKKQLNGVSLGLRVNPGYSEIKTDLYNPALPNSRLGVLSSEITSLPDRVEGLHFHALCENDSYSLENVLKAFEEKFGQYLPQIKWVNFGGGHLITEKNYDVDHAISVLNAFKNRHPHLQVILEPGSAFTWQTGFLKASVVDVTNREGLNIAMLDVSFTAHMPDCLEMPYQPKIRKAYSDQNKVETILGGNTCLSGDFMKGYFLEKPLVAGDELIFEDMIHYTTVKTSQFNGVEHPSIGLLDEDGEFLLLRKYHYQDFKQRMA